MSIGASWKPLNCKDKNSEMGEGNFSEKTLPFSKAKV
jgi:hypothetical protein